MPESSTEALATKNDAVEKRGRVLSSKNEGKIRAARDHLNDVLAEVEQQPEDDEKSASGADGFPPRRTQAPPEPGGAHERAHGNDEDGAVEKGAIPPHTTPMADEDTPWDGPAVVAELPNERAVLRRVHAWVDDEGDPDVKNSYKFPHHLADGRVVLRGVNNAMARLSQATIPAGDRDGVERHLRRHQEQFNKDANTSTPGERPAGSVLAGNDEAETAAAAERELAEVLGQYLKTLKEVLT
jgi:hypothetical protein